MKGSSQDTQAGYVLLLSAGVIAILSVTAFLALQTMADARTAVRRAQQDVAEDIRMRTVVSHLAFRFLTEPWSERAILLGADRSATGQLGAGPSTRAASGRVIRNIELDGRPYIVRESRRVADKVRPGMIVVLQDEGGLLNLNSGDEAATAELLTRQGATTSTARMLAATLADFIDGDDLVRLGGAEKSDYGPEDEDLPPNRPILEASEAQFALGWRFRLSPDQRRGAFQLSSAGAPQTGVNVNTAPFPVLVAVLVDSDRARAVDDFRRSSIISDTAVLEGVVGPIGRASSINLAVRPSGRVRIYVRSARRHAPWNTFVYAPAGEGADRPFHLSLRSRMPPPLSAKEEQDLVDRAEVLPDDAIFPDAGEWRDPR